MRTSAVTQYNVEFPSAPGVQQRLTRLLHKSNVDLKSMVTARVGPKTTMQFLAPKRDALRMNLKRMRVSVWMKLVSAQRSCPSACRISRRSLAW